VNNVEEIMHKLQQTIQNGTDIIPINFKVKPTKGQASVCHGYLKRDRSTEESASTWLNERTSFTEIAEKYKKYDPTAIITEWPHHYASRFISMSGVLAEGRNIFIVFPLALGRAGKTESDYFGFEFIDVWEKVFDSIVFPCVEAVFCQESIAEISHVLKPVITKTIYLASVFHEIGHRIGPWQVVPKRKSSLKLSRFYMDVLCELATDAFLASFLTEFPEIKYFVILQRLFWFGRFGFSEADQNGDINKDNDTWIASYLWIKLTKHSCIQKAGGKLAINISKADQVFSEIINELECLGRQVYADNLNQDRLVHEWMSRSAPKLVDRFTIPTDLQKMFLHCTDINTKVEIKFD
jgi:hypothetical protein